MHGCNISITVLLCGVSVTEYQPKPSQTKPNQTKPNQTKPNQTKPNQTKLAPVLVVYVLREHIAME
jgi:hypothetical protein